MMVAPPRDSAAYRHYFCCQQAGNAEQLKDNEAKRLQLYKHVSTLIRAFASIASELAEAGYTATEIERIKAAAGIEAAREKGEVDAEIARTKAKAKPNKETA